VKGKGGAEREKMACQPKREHQTTVADSDGNCCIIHPSTRDPRPHRQSCQIVLGGGGIPAHDRSADFQSAYPVLPCRDSLGPRPRPFSRGAETQNHSKTPAIKPHQTPSAGGEGAPVRHPLATTCTLALQLWPLAFGLWTMDCRPPQTIGWLSPFPSAYHTATK
jgi:hypothetical protein